MTTFYKNYLVVKRSKIDGYGVFAGKKIARDELIEKTHIVIFDYQPTAKGAPNNDPLRNYYFAVSDPEKKALPLGLGVLYNHANEPNASYCFDIEAQTVTIKALRPIAKGEEILISYMPQWFEYRDIPVIPPARVFCWTSFLRSNAFKASFLLAFILLTSVLLKHKPPPKDALPHFIVERSIH